MLSWNPASKERSSKVTICGFVSSQQSIQGLGDKSSDLEVQGKSKEEGVWSPRDEFLLNRYSVQEGRCMFWIYIHFMEKQA